ncbi:hypothetical protein GW17_00049177 [Ensete ventricosum]|nr:hypothetical protein GW17_00049177 [Ensete ventricosum]
MCRRRRYTCPLAAALSRGGHPYSRRRHPYWRQGWPRAAVPCGHTVDGPHLRAGRSRPCPRVAAPCRGLATADRPLVGGTSRSRLPPYREALATAGRPCRGAGRGHARLLPAAPAGGLAVAMPGCPLHLLLSL